MLICDKCGLRETIDIKTFITRLVQGDKQEGKQVVNTRIYDKRLYCQQCKQILTTIYVNSLFEKILHFDKTDLYTLFDIANKVGVSAGISANVQNNMLQGGGNDVEDDDAIKKLPNEEYTQMIEKVDYKNCIEYMTILYDLITANANNTQTQQQIFSEDYDQIRQLIQSLYSNQQNKDEITLVGFVKEPVGYDFKTLNNKGYQKKISIYSVNFRERFTSYIRYWKITNTNKLNTDAEIADTDEYKLICQMFLIIAAIYQQSDNIKLVKEKGQIQIDNVKITSMRSISIQLTKHHETYKEYKINIVKRFLTNDNIKTLNKYLQSIYILFDDEFNIKGYSLLHGILYIMTQQQPNIDLKIISPENIENNKTQLSSLFKLTKLTYDAYQTFGQYYVTSNENKQGYMFIEFYKLFQMNIYDRYYLIDDTLKYLEIQLKKQQLEKKQLPKKQLCFTDFKKNFGFVPNETNLLNVNINGICKLIKASFEQLLIFFEIKQLDEKHKTEYLLNLKQDICLKQFYVLLLMLFNYLYAYNQINSVRGNDNTKMADYVNQLYNAYHLSSSFKDINSNGFNIYCLLFYISLKIYLDEITNNNTTNVKNPNRQIQINDLTKNFIELLYNKLIEIISPQINASENRIAQYQNPYELLADLIVYILKQNNSKSK